MPSVLVTEPSSGQVDRARAQRSARYAWIGDGNYEADTAEPQRLEDEERIGHGPPSRA